MKRFAMAMLWVSLACAAAVAQDKESFTVPFETKQNLILVKGSINGNDGHIFILDTGASVTCITPKAAKKAGVAKGGMLTRIDGIGAGRAVVDGVQAAIMDPPQAQFLRTGLGVDYSGILGHSYLTKFVTTFDYAKKELTFVPRKFASSLETEGKESWILKFKTVNNIIMVEGAVNGKGPYMFIFDSGATETIVTPELAAELDLKGEKIQSGLGPTEKVKLDSLKAGDAEVKGLNVFVLDPPQAQPLKMLGGHYHGILGAPFLRRFKITLDYKAKQIRLTLNGTTAEDTVKTESAKTFTPENAALKAQILRQLEELLRAQREQLLRDIERILDEKLK